MHLSIFEIIANLLFLGLIYIVLPALIIYALVLIFKREKSPYNLP